VRRAVLVSLAGVAVASALFLTPTPLAGQEATRSSRPSSSPARPWSPPRTAWGEPDLQGTWDFRTATPLERPAQFAGREFLTDAEAAELEQRAARRLEGRREDAPATPSVHPPYWLDFGTKVVDTKRTSLITDPPTGRVPPLTPDAQQRAAARAETRRARGPADSWEDRSLWERCLTRGLPEAMLPGGYNSNVQILQTPGYVVIVMEMIHDARIVPLNGSPHLGPSLRQWHGDPRGHWEGNTLVVESTNFSSKTSFRGSGENLRLVERFTRTANDAMTYEFTVSDPTTWTQPWTAALPVTKIPERLYEYACHEGNYGLRNILSVSRAEDAARDGERKKP
jgi:hypothetical protein